MDIEKNKKIDKVTEIETIINRIRQLEFLKKYFSGLFKNKPFEIKIQGRILVDTEITNDQFYENKMGIDNSQSDWEQDKQYFLDSIDARIEELTEMLNPLNLPTNNKILMTF